jgi:hypothetical protein
MRPLHYERKLDIMHHQSQTFIKEPPHRGNNAKEAQAAGNR